LAGANTVTLTRQLNGESRDALARQFVDESDASRIAYIAQIFSSLGFAAGEARHRAVMAYSLDVACSQLTTAGGVWSRDDLLKAAAAMLAAPGLNAMGKAHATR
jgi:hypothetical protein